MRRETVIHCQFAVPTPAATRAENRAEQAAHRRHTNRPTHVTVDDDRYERKGIPCGRRLQRKDTDVRASARFGRTAEPDFSARVAAGVIRTAKLSDRIAVSTAGRE
jgi:hypothetical protein